MNDLTDIPERKFFTPGENIVEEQVKGKFICLDVKMQATCFNCGSSMCRHQPRGFFYCINEACSESRKNCNEDNRFMTGVFIRWLVAFGIAILGTVMLSTGYRDLYIVDTDKIEVGARLLTSIVAFIAAIFVAKDADNNVLWNNLCDREDKFFDVDVDSTDENYNRKYLQSNYKIPSFPRNEWKTVTFHYPPKYWGIKGRREFQEKYKVARENSQGLASAFPKAKQRQS